MRYTPLYRDTTPYPHICQLTVQLEVLGCRAWGCRAQCVRFGVEGLQFVVWSFVRGFEVWGIVFLRVYA